MCGEKSIRRIMQSKVMGSPPRMRGKAVAIFRQLHHGRITPAYAGKRDSIPQQSSLRRDHPRVCGEKPRIFFMSIRSAGSPPRMRGKGQPLYIVVSESGITPACAGKSLVRELLLIVSRDHPRVCGEKPPKGCGLNLILGSPPRVRGKVRHARIDCARLGITPACAGKRLKRSHSIGHFSCILCLFHSVLHRASVSGGSRAGPCAPPCLPAQNAVPV